MRRTKPRALGSGVASLPLGLCPSTLPAAEAGAGSLAGEWARERVRKREMLDFTSSPLAGELGSPCFSWVSFQPVTLRALIPAEDPTRNPPRKERPSRATQHPPTFKS